LEHLDWLSKQPVEDRKKMDYALRQYQNIFTYLSYEGNEKARLNFHKKIDSLDKIREEIFTKVFPELKSMIEN
jgi:hypothetical protein